MTGAATASVTANTSGVYSFSGIANGSGTVTPSKTGFTFTPANQAVTVNGANATANFLVGRAGHDQQYLALVSHSCNGG
jgi:hypothetical protein